MTMDNRTIPWTFVLDEPLRILVVDDDAILREFANVYLSTPSVTIDTASDGRAAQVRLRENSYDLLLLDIEMPNLDGFSLLGEIRSTDALKDLPVIMLTGHDDIASIDRAYQLGANSFATKPVNWRQLSYHIRYVLRMGRMDLQSGRPHRPARQPGSEPVSPAAETGTAAFLQSIIDGADALEGRLTGQDRARYSESIQSIRTTATRALKEGSGHASACAIPAHAVSTYR